MDLTAGVHVLADLDLLVRSRLDEDEERDIGVEGEQGHGDGDVVGQALVGHGDGPGSPPDATASASSRT